MPVYGLCEMPSMVLITHKKSHNDNIMYRNRYRLKATLSQAELLA